MAEAAVKDSDVSIRRMGTRTELRMKSHPAVLRPVRLALEEHALAYGLTEELAQKIGLALNEALANVIRHGYGGAVDQPIMVAFDFRGEGHAAEMRVEIRDWAKPVDPSKLPESTPRDGPLDVETVKPGGLGLLCMRRLMDEVTFSPQPDGTLLTMVKKLGNLKH
jgi:anti-sigma regulatory factor (Ser/Thr protein kinase)